MYDHTLLTLDDFKKALHRIKNHIRKTPLDYSEYFSQKSGAKVYLKCENLQITGSFKLRGAMNAMLSLSQEQQKKGVVTASAGNHGKAISFCAQLLSLPASIYVPEYIQKTKIQAIISYGANLHVEGKIFDESELLARKAEKTEGKIYISAYNDEFVIAGQGTIGLEIFEDLEHVDSILIPISGGGLFAGVAASVKGLYPHIKCYGVQAEAAPVMYESLRQGKLVSTPEEETIAEVLSGGIEEGCITFPYVEKYCEEILLVNESEIKAALIEFISHHKMLCEGGSAVGLAAVKKFKEKFIGETVVIIITGSNIDFENVKSLICDTI